MAKQMQTLSDRKKLEIFTKYELINIKTYKCRNKQNLSPIANLEFDPKSVVKDPAELYAPRLRAFNAVSRHMNDIDQVSAKWLH